MGKAIGSALPLAVGIALSPVPIIAVILVLTSRRARVNGPAFVVGWLAGLGLVGTIILILVSPSGAGRPGGRTSWLDWTEIVLGLLLLLIAIRQFRNRPRGGDEPPLPKWTATLDNTSPVAALGLAVVLSAANPKNLVLAAGGATAIARTGIPASQQAVAYVVFALIGTLSIGIPVVMYLALGKSSEKLLLRLKDWTTRHNASIVIVLCLVIAARLFGDAIGGLTG